MKSFDEFKSTLSLEKLNSEVMKPLQVNSMSSFSDHDIKLAVAISTGVAAANLELLKQL